MVRAFKYRSNIQEIPRIREDLDLLKQEWDIPDSEIRQIQVIIEELFSNIVRFAFDDTKEHPIDIRLGCSNSQIEIEMIDDGVAFNPLEYQTGPLANPASSDAGGMGLTLIKAFSKDVSYQRNAGKNHLKINKTVKRR